MQRALTTAGVAQGRWPVGARSLDLKRSLMLRVVAAAAACFLVAAAIALYGTYHAFRQTNENVADVVVRQLQLQLFRIRADIGASSAFPDWDPVVSRVQGPGQCIRYLESGGVLGRSSCVGVGDGEGRPPGWLSSAGRWLLAGRAAVARPVSYGGKTYGTVVVTIEPAVVLAAIWKDVSGLLGLTALLVAAICLLQYVAIARALRPTKDILAGLDRLARGDLSCRLPSFHLIELRRISDVFNALADSLERTTHERTALAARLVDGQERERCHLARELHDELAQTLTAINAAAASIKATATAHCPALVPEADGLARMSMATMRSLRTTLQNLRPPEIDDFGLAGSLAELVASQEAKAGGRLQISLDIGGDLHGLSPTAASHVYRIVQEGLTNVGKHAQASRARVALALRPETPERDPSRQRWLALTIEDDGCGALANGKAEGSGLGLVGMRERALALGGQLDIVRLDHGFKLQAQIPFAAPAPAAS